MAAPIGHIYLALKMLAGPLQGVDAQAFLVGTMVPDMRYWAHIPREYTHKKDVLFEDVLREPDAFKAGVLFHSLVDNVREDFFKRHPVPAMVRLADYRGYLMKNIEDIILGDRLLDKSFVRHFDDVLEPEVRLVGDRDLVQKWHRMLQQYFLDGPTAQTIYRLLYQDVPKKNSYKYMGIKIFYELSSRLAPIERIKKSVLSFYDNFYDYIFFDKNASDLRNNVSSGSVPICCP